MFLILSSIVVKKREENATNNENCLGDFVCVCEKWEKKKIKNKKNNFAHCLFFYNIGYNRLFRQIQCQTLTNVFYYSVAT